MNISCSS